MFIYPAVLILLTLAVLARGTPVPDPTPVAVERCLTLNPDMVDLVDEEHRRQNSEGTWVQCDMYWPFPTPDPTLVAKDAPAQMAIQQYRYMKQLEAMEA